MAEWGNQSDPADMKMEQKQTGDIGNLNMDPNKIEYRETYLFTLTRKT